MNEVLNIRDNLEFFEEIEDERNTKFNSIIFYMEYLILSESANIAEEIKNDYDYERDKLPNYLNIGPYHRKKINEYNKEHGTQRETYLSKEEYERIYEKEIEEQGEKDTSHQIKELMPRFRKLHKKMINYILARNKLFKKAISINLPIEEWELFNSNVTKIEQKIFDIQEKSGLLEFEDVHKIEQFFELVSSVLFYKLKHLFFYSDIKNPIDKINNVIKSLKQVLWDANSIKTISDKYWTTVKEYLEKNIPATENIKIDKVMQIFKAMKPRNARQIIETWSS